MSTQIWLRKESTVPSAYAWASEPNPALRDMTTANGATIAVTATMPAGSDTSGTEFLLKHANAGPVYVPLVFWSERVTAQVTISGSISVSLRAFTSTGGTVRMRMKLWKVTYGGSNVETLIGQGEGTADLGTANAVYAFTIVPSSSVTLAVNERFIVRVYAIPSPVSGNYGTPSGAIATMSYSSGGATGNCSITFAETFTFKANGTRLHLRRTSTIGIGTFMDLLEQIGSSVNTTAIVNTTNGGTEIQWTKTAGGALAAWISNRIKAPGWAPTGATNIQGAITVSESTVAVNAVMRAKVFRRRPDGSETLLFTRTYGVEMSTSNRNEPMSGANGTDDFVSGVTFVEDDRIVVRVYASNIGTMAAGTATLYYDDLSSGSSLDSNLFLLDSPEFKAETDPGAGPVPSKMTMTGTGS